MAILDKAQNQRRDPKAGFAIRDRVTAEGGTQDEAAENACRQAFAQLLLADPSQVVLRPKYSRFRRTLCWNGFSSASLSASSTRLCQCMCGRAWARLERRMRRCYLGRCRGVCRFGARLCQCRGSSSSSSNSTSRPLYRTRVGRLTWGTVHTYSSDGWCSAAAALVRPSAAAPAFLPPVGRGRPCGPPGRKK